MAAALRIAARTFGLFDAAQPGAAATRRGPAPP